MKYVSYVEILILPSRLSLLHALAMFSTCCINWCCASPCLLLTHSLVLYFHKVTVLGIDLTAPNGQSYRFHVVCHYSSTILTCIFLGHLYQPFHRVSLDPSTPPGAATCRLSDAATLRPSGCSRSSHVTSRLPTKHSGMKP